MLALDDLFQIDLMSDRSAPVQSERAIELVQRIDDYVATYPTAPIHAADLAREFDVSIRTVGGAVSKVRGMSLHQYIRLKRLWATRARLLKGGGPAHAPRGRNPATTRSARGCHPSLRYVSLPMSPGRTIEDWRARKDSNLRPSESKSDALSS